MVNAHFQTKLISLRRTLFTDIKKCLYFKSEDTEKSLKNIVHLHLNAWKVVTFANYKIISCATKTHFFIIVDEDFYYYIQKLDVHDGRHRLFFCSH